MSDTVDSIHLDRFQSLERVATPRRFFSVARVLLLLLAVTVLALVAVPWQQSISATGRVTYLSPMDRPRAVEAPLTGHIEKWHVMEGQTVKAGDLLVELTEIDTRYLDRRLLERLQAKRRALLDKRRALEEGAAALEKQLEALRQLARYASPAAEEKIHQAKAKLAAARQALYTARQNERRFRQLFDEGLRSQRDLELVRMALAKAEAELETARRQVAIARLERQKIIAENQAKIEAVRVKLASLRRSMAEVDHEIQSLDIKIGNTAARIAMRQVRAPVDGKVVRVLALGSGETVKQGDPLVIIAPKGQHQAVELYVRDHDVTLLAPGRPVRLQFAGWPAIQFTGWPSLAVGTFGGRIAVIDSVDDGKHRYRVLVVPDEEAIRSGRDEPWPTYPYLRPGTRVQGWILLDTVSLGFELWRRFNAFPPFVEAPAPTTSAKDGKRP